MSKKIKITETQYKNLQQFLMETPFEKMVKTNIKPNDVIRITIGNLIKKYKVVSSYGGQIQMDGMDTDDSENRYFISSGSFDKNEIEGKKINKVKNPELLKSNPKDWENFFTKISNFEVFRNGQIVDAVDINGKSSFTPPQPVPTQSGTTQSGTTQTQNLNPEVEKDKKTKELGKKAMEMIINDPQMKAAFFRQPSFWRLFVADMKGQTAVGKGILPTLDIVGKYMDKQTNKKLGTSAFINNKIAKFIILDDFELEYIDNNNEEKTYPIAANTKSEATNTRENLWDEKMQIYKDFKILSNKKNENGIGVPFKIAVKKRTKNEDVFLCRFIGFFNGRESFFDNIRIRFIQSNGYDKTNTNKTRE
jgi:hypothetical protein